MSLCVLLTSLQQTLTYTKPADVVCTFKCFRSKILRRQPLGGLFQLSPQECHGPLSADLPLVPSCSCLLMGGGGGVGVAASAQL